MTQLMGAQTSADPRKAAAGGQTPSAAKKGTDAPDAAG
jgi:hypothetical protein